MSKFIPSSETKAQELLTKIQKSPMPVNTPEEFVNIYNSGWINQNNNDVVELVNDVVETYKDVEKKGRQIIFLDEDEVYVNELIESFDSLSIAVKLRRILRTVENVPEFIVFDNESVGYAYGEHTLEDEEVTQISSEKLFYKEDDVEKFFKTFSSVRNDSEHGYVFKSTDFTDLDTSNIKEAYNLFN